MNDENSQTLRESLQEQFSEVNEVLPDLDLRQHLSDEYQEICEVIAAVQIEFAAMRQIIAHQLGVTRHASP